MILEVFTGSVIYLLVLASFFREDVDRFAIQSCAFGWAAFQILNDLFGEKWGFTYYFGAVITDLIVIKSLNVPIHPTLALIRMQTICLWFIYVNVFGWIIYEAGHDPFSYNLLCGILFILALIISFLKGNSNVLGNIKLFGNGFSFYSFHFTRNTNLSSNSKKAKI